LKFSIIKPIYKKGDRIKPTNYRPISILTSFLKVFGNVLYITLTEHFYDHKVLVGNQFGFIKGIATEDSFIHSFASVLSHLVTMDLSKFIQFEYNLIFNKHT